MVKKNKGGWLINVFAVLLFLLGISIFMYPTVSNWLAEQNQAEVIQTYDETLALQTQEFYDAEMAKAKAYNDSLVGDPVQDPFVPGSGYALPENYLDCLNIDGVMGYIEIPKISVYLPIYHGSSEEVLQKGVGHIESTALPIGGDYTRSVLTGHRGLPSAKLFTDLDKLEVGDQFYIHVLDEVLAYEVCDIETIEPTDLQSLMAVPGEDLVTLVTCTPYGINTHRLLITGTRVPYVPSEADEYRETVGVVAFDIFNVKLTTIGLGIGLFFLILLILILVILKKKKVKKYGKKKKKK